MTRRHERTYRMCERTITIVGSIAIASSGLYAFLIAGVTRILLGWDENFCMIWIGIPTFVILLVVRIFVLPKHLRRAGLID